MGPVNSADGCGQLLVRAATREGKAAQGGADLAEDCSSWARDDGLSRTRGARHAPCPEAQARLRLHQLRGVPRDECFLDHSEGQSSM